MRRPAAEMDEAIVLGDTAVGVGLRGECRGDPCRLLARQRRRGGVEAALPAGRAQVAHEPEPVAITHRPPLDIDAGKPDADALDQIAHRGKLALLTTPGASQTCRTSV